MRIRVVTNIQNTIIDFACDEKSSQDLEKVVLDTLKEKRTLVLNGKTHTTIIPFGVLQNSVIFVEE